METELKVLKLSVPNLKYMNQILRRGLKKGSEFQPPDWVLKDRATKLGGPKTEIEGKASSKKQYKFEVWSLNENLFFKGKE